MTNGRGAREREFSAPSDLDELPAVTGDRDREAVAEFNRSRSPVIIHGAGIMAGMLRRRIRALGGRVEALAVDGPGASTASDSDGLKILAADDLDDHYAEYNLVVGFYQGLALPYPPAGRFRNAARIYKFFNPGYALPVWPETPGGTGGNYFIQQLDKFKNTYSLLADDLSRKMMLAFLKGQLSHDFDCTAPYVRSPAYFFDDFFTWSGQEAFVDCGAYDGDSLEGFLRFTGGRYAHIWAIEPDKASFGRLAEFVAGRALEKVTLINQAVFSRPARLSFAGGLKQGSHVSARAGGEGAEVEAEALDNLIGGDQAVSFIKMDLEGGELEALQGGAATIKKHRPKLAVCAYHRADDLIVLPAYIKELVPEYRLFFRLHGYGPVDAVLYAAV